MQATGCSSRERAVLEHSPERIDEWARELRQRFKGKCGQTIAVALELDKGPIVAALRKYDFLVLFPVNPTTLATVPAARKTASRKTNWICLPTAPPVTRGGPTSSGCCWLHWPTR